MNVSWLGLRMIVCDLSGSITGRKPSVTTGNGPRPVTRVAWQSYLRARASERGAKKRADKENGYWPDPSNTPSGLALLGPSTESDERTPAATSSASLRKMFLSTPGISTLVCAFKWPSENKI